MHKKEFFLFSLYNPPIPLTLAWFSFTAGCEIIRKAFKNQCLTHIQFQYLKSGYFYRRHLACPLSGFSARELKTCCLRAVLQSQPAAPQHRSTNTCRSLGLVGLGAVSITWQMLLIITGRKHSFSLIQECNSLVLLFMLDWKTNSHFTTIRGIFSIILIESITLFSDWWSLNIKMWIKVDQNKS